MSQGFAEPQFNQRFDVQKNEKLKIAYWMSGGGSGEDLDYRAAKKKIVKLLAGMNFGVNVTPLERSSVIDVAGESIDLTHEVRNSGIVNVLGNVGYYGHPIRNGAPICFDVDTGYAVTGVNPQWHPSEYKLVGTAYGELSSGTGLVPCKLGPAPAGAGTVNRMAVLYEVLRKGKSAQAVLLRPANPSEALDNTAEILQWEFDEWIVVWDYLMTYPDDYIDPDVKVIVSQEPSSGLWVVNNPTCSPGGIETVNGSVDSAPIP